MALLPGDAPTELQKAFVETCLRSPTMVSFFSAYREKSFFEACLVGAQRDVFFWRGVKMPGAACGYVVLPRRP